MCTDKDEGKPNLVSLSEFPLSYWNEDETVWVQPPVKINHGDLVDIKYVGRQTILGRYIGKGLGVAELFHYAKGLTYHTGKVTNRSLDGNPRLISDENLLKYIED